MKKFILELKMQLIRVSNNITTFFLIILFSIFAMAFYRVGQYWISLLSLGLLLISIKYKDIKKISVGSKGILAEYEESNKEIIKVLESKDSEEEKAQKLQKLTDEAFSLGFKVAAGRPLGDISNVKIYRDSKGNITGAQYDQT